MSSFCPMVGGMTAWRPSSEVKNDSEMALIYTPLSFGAPKSQKHSIVVVTKANVGGMGVEFSPL
jgi:hypothetical protein